MAEGGTKRRLSAGELAAYDAPFPDEAFKAAARIYPSLVPVRYEDPEAAKCRDAWTVYQEWKKPFILGYSDGDPITRRARDRFLREIPGAQGQAHRTLHGGHFIQEDDPAAFAEMVIAACRKNS